MARAPHDAGPRVRLAWARLWAANRAAMAARPVAARPWARAAVAGTIALGAVTGAVAASGGPHTANVWHPCAHGGQRPAYALCAGPASVPGMRGGPP